VHRTTLAWAIKSQAAGVQLQLLPPKTTGWRRVCRPLLLLLLLPLVPLVPRLLPLLLLLLLLHRQRREARKTVAQGRVSRGGALRPRVLVGL
jgi:hypothetical protein